MLTVDEARARILAAIAPLGAETVFLGDALDRVLAEELRSARAVPGSDNSAMDGYGVRAADVAATPATLTVVDAVQAGHPRDVVVGAGQATRIMTGGKVPVGVDAVVMREACDESEVTDAGGVVVVKEGVAVGANIRRRGEDVQQGDVVGAVGDVLRPARINLLAQTGHVAAHVARRPTVAILASGDELKEVGAPLSDDDVVDSNAHALAAAVRAAGAVPHLVGIAKDTLDDHARRIDAAAYADVLLTIGGVSVGTHDFVRPALEKVGASIDLWRIAMRPGKPLAFGRRDFAGRAQAIFGLPGNPVSSLVGFELFVKPALKKLQGRRDVVARGVPARLVDDVKKKAGLAFYLRARVTLDDGGFVARVLDKQGSGQVSALAAANALVVVPQDVEQLQAGAVVEALLLDESALTST